MSRLFGAVRSAKANDGPKTLAVKASSHQLTVLVVADEAVMRVMLREALQRQGFQVLLATSSQDAIKILQKHGATISVVLLDVFMQNLDTSTNLDSLRELNPEIPVFFTSGDTSVFEPRNLRTRISCAKAFRLDELASMLHLAIQRVPVDPLLS